MAIVAGVVATFAPPAPTGNATIDTALVGVGVGLIVLIGALAPWWAVAIATGAALAIAVDPLLMLVAALALGLALWLGATRRTSPALSAVAIAVAFNVMARAELAGFLGLSALVAVAAAFVVFVTAIGRHTRLVRRLSLAGIGLAVVFVGLASVGFAYEAARSRHELAGGLNAAEQGVVLLEIDEFDAAARYFREASAALDVAHERVGGPLAAGAAFVPILAQHRSAIVDMSGVGSDGAATVADALDQIDLDALRTVDGRINLEALAALEAPLTRVREALVTLQQTTNDARSQWLVRRATYELDDFDESVDEHLPSLDNALDAIRMAPTMLGVDGPRTYLVVFTTPSESRGLGGMIGNYAELTVDDGLMSLSGFGRGEDLDAAASGAGVRLDGPDGFLEQYGRFGFDTDGAGLVGNSAMRNVAMSPNFPWVGEVVSDVYTQTTGRAVDGVIVMDPYVVAALLQYTGPIQLATLDQELNAGNAVPFLLRDQYVMAEDKDVRIDALAEAASITFEALLADSLPEPITIARDLGPLVAERRLLVWSAEPDEQALLERAHLAGQIPTPDGADGWSFTVTNGGANKIDSFLERSAGYTSTTDPATGETTATLHVRLKNTAPADGFPAYVIGNRVGLPPGTSRLYVSFYSPLPLTGVTLDGQPTGLAVGQELGWNVYSGFVEIPSDGTVDFELQLAGTLEHPDDDLVTWEQPMGSPVQPL